MPNILDQRVAHYTAAQALRTAAEGVNDPRVEHRSVPVPLCYLTTEERAQLYALLDHAHIRHVESGDALMPHRAREEG